MSRLLSPYALVSALAALPLMVAAPAAMAFAQDGHASHHQAGHQHAAFESDRIHVLVEGLESGPDVVLIPGLSSSPRVWEDTVARLSATHRLHLIHVNGFGGAPAEGNAQPGDEPSPFLVPVAEEIARYIREGGLQKPSLIGHSMGGSLSMIIATRHPEAVSKVMVVDMLPFMGAMFGPPGTTAESVKPTAQNLWQMQSSIARADYDAFAVNTINGMINTESRREGALQDVYGSDQRTSAAAYYDLVVTDLRPDLPKFTGPMTVLYVKFNDARMTNEITDMIYGASFATRPATTLKRIDNSAHFIMFDQPDVFAAEVDAFLTSN